MKRIDLVMVLVVAALVAWYFRPASPPEERLYGTWVGQEGDDRIELEFRPEHVVQVREDGESKTARYTTNFEAHPHHMDLFLDKERVLTIFEFTPEGDLRISDNNEGNPRPVKLGDKKTLIFKRK